MRKRKPRTVETWQSPNFARPPVIDEQRKPTWCDHENYVDERNMRDVNETRICLDCGATKVLEPEPHEHYWYEVHAPGVGSQNERCECGAVRQTIENVYNAEGERTPGRMTITPQRKWSI